MIPFILPIVGLLLKILINSHQHDLENDKLNKDNTNEHGKLDEEKPMWFQTYTNCWQPRKPGSRSLPKRRAQQYIVQYLKTFKEMILYELNKLCLGIYMYIQINKGKKILTLKENGEGYMGMIGGSKGKGAKIKKCFINKRFQKGRKKERKSMLLTALKFHFI